MSAKHPYFDSNPTPAEITAILGPGWAVCRATAKNLERYQRCVSLKTYRAAVAEAMRRRVKLAGSVAPSP